MKGAEARKSTPRNFGDESAQPQFSSAFGSGKGSRILAQSGFLRSDSPANER